MPPPWRLTRNYAGRRAPVRHYVKKHLHNARLRTVAGLAALANPIR
jgi:hypothetical protein